MVFCLKQFAFSQQALDLKIFGAGRLRISGSSPSTVNGMGEVHHLYPWFGVALVFICHPLSGLGQNLSVSIAKGQAAALCWHSWKRQHKPNGLRSLGYVLRE